MSYGDIFIINISIWLTGPRLALRVCFAASLLTNHVFYQLPEASGCLIPDREVELDLDRSHGNIIGDGSKSTSLPLCLFLLSVRGIWNRCGSESFSLFYLFQASKEGRDACL